MKQVKKGFTLIELLVVVAIIAILAAIAIPQYNKYRTNAMLSNVQGMVKSVATQAIALATTAGQNPKGTGSNVFVVKFEIENSTIGVLKAYLENGTDVLDQVQIYSNTPNWLESIELESPNLSGLKLTIEGTKVSFSDGAVIVKSTYKVDETNKLGCKYYPDNDTLDDPGEGYICRTK